MVNSLIPALEECEKFINFLNEKFKLKLPSDYIVTINKADKSVIGHFGSKEIEERFINGDTDLNTINLNTYYLKSSNPYEVLTHELAHFLNFLNKVEDVTSNNYHNKNFKKTAESLKLKVSRGKKGYNITEGTEEFNKLVDEFKPEREVFKIFQRQAVKKKVGSRLKLYVCECGIKVRCARELNAMCYTCEGDFKLVV